MAIVLFCDMARRLRPAGLAVLVSFLAAPALAGTREMLAALHAGDIDAMRAELAAGADPNGGHGTPLPMATWLPAYLAAEAGNEAALALLVEHGADIDLRDRNGDRPLDWAARYGELEVVRLLVGAGAAPDPREAGDDVKVPLVEAAKGGHAAVAHFLLDSGADPNRGTRYAGTPLHHAAGQGDTTVAARLLAMGADPAARRAMTFETPLHNAAERRDAEAARLLIEAGAPLDARDWEGETPIFRAARIGHHEIVAVLLEAGAALDIRDDKGHSPLVAALTNRPKPGWESGLDDPFVSTRDLILAQADRPAHRDFEAVARLLAARTQDLDIALAEAVWGGWEEAALILIARGALVKGHTLDGRATLAGSFFYPGLSMFDRLVAANVALGLAGAETIVAAAAAGRMDIPRALFAQRWQVDTPAALGRTALMAAAAEGRVSTAAELLARGADPALRDTLGRGILDHMKLRLADLIGLALSRECSRAHQPTDIIRGEAARLNAAYEEMLPSLGLAAHAGTLMPAQERNC